MEGSGVSSADVGDVRRRQRTVSSRRPRSSTQVFLVHDISPLSSTPSSDDANKTSPDDSMSYDHSQRRKEHNMINPVTRTAPSKVVEGTTSKKLKKDDKRFGNLEDLYRVDNLRNELSRHSNQRQNAVKSKRDNEGSLASGNWNSSDKVNKGTPKVRGNSDDNNSGDVHDVESKPKKVKLKVGGVTCTINAKSSFSTDKLDSSSTKHSVSLNAPRHQQKHYLQENSTDVLTPQDKRGDLQHTRAKKHPRDSVTEENLHCKQRDRLQDIEPKEPVRKSQRVQQRRLLDGIDSAIEDKDMRYEKSKTLTSSTDNSDEVEEGAEDSSFLKHTSKVPKTPRNLYNVDEDYDLTSSKEKRKITRSIGKSFDGEYMEEDELSSEDEPDLKRKKPKRNTVGLSTGGKSELLMTRQRALQSGKGAGESSVEFSELPPTSSRAKVKLSEVEQQAKKAEAAQRRRMQVEKQARESQAEAIRRILGQDSSRKKKEYKRKEKDAESLVLMPNTIRWVMGPTGTVITFADDVGLPSILESKKCSYPPSREKCAGPSCTNAYKYRDSKSNLPLCSLQCYRAVRKIV